MNRRGRSGRLGALSIGIAIGLVACSDGPRTDAPENASADIIPVYLQTREIEGLCYAPRSINFNGNLQLDDLDGNDTYALRPVSASQVENVAAILSMPRERVSGSGIEVLVPREAVLAYPSYLQVVLFPCDSPLRAEGEVAGLSILSARLHLQPAVPQPR